MSLRGRFGAPRGRFAFIPLVAAAAALALGGVVTALWNAILPETVGAGRLSYWQGVGLLVMCRILFGGFGGGRRGGPGWGRRPMGGGDPRPPREKWRQMSDDERRQFRQQWQERCRNRRGRPEEPGV
jgi:hypothetical protein